MTSTGLEKQHRYDMCYIGKQQRYGLYWTWETAEIWPLLGLGNSSIWPLLYFGNIKDIASTGLGKQQRCGHHRRLGKQQRYGLYWT
jgi:hypothetical protein